MSLPSHTSEALLSVYAPVYSYSNVTGLVRSVQILENSKGEDRNTDWLESGPVSH